MRPRAHGQTDRAGPRCRHAHDSRAVGSRPRPRGQRARTAARRGHGPDPRSQPRRGPDPRAHARPCRGGRRSPCRGDGADGERRRRLVRRAQCDRRGERTATRGARTAMASAVRRGQATRPPSSPARAAATGRGGCSSTHRNPMRSMEARMEARRRPSAWTPPLAPGRESATLVPCTSRSSPQSTRSVTTRPRGAGPHARAIDLGTPSARRRVPRRPRMSTASTRSSPARSARTPSRRMRRFGALVENAPGARVPVATTVVPSAGFPARALHDLAEQEEASLLVLGSSRRGHWAASSPVQSPTACSTAPPVRWRLRRAASRSRMPTPGRG